MNYPPDLTKNEALYEWARALRQLQRRRCDSALAFGKRVSVKRAAGILPAKWDDSCLNDLPARCRQHLTRHLQAPLNRYGNGERVRVKGFSSVGVNRCLCEVSFLRQVDSRQAPSNRSSYEKKINLNDIPWRERKSPIWCNPDSNKWGFSLEHVGSFCIRPVNYFDGEK